MARTLPLTWGDEAILHLESASDPWNIQMEIGDTQRIDPAHSRLRSMPRAWRTP